MDVAAGALGDPQPLPHQADAQPRQHGVRKNTRAVQAAHCAQGIVQVDDELGPLDGARIDALRRGDLDAAVFSEAERAALDFADEVFATRRVSDATMAAVEAHVSSRQVVELVLTSGSFMMMDDAAATRHPEQESTPGEGVMESVAGVYPLS